MLGRTLNLGILAHVDAGKTTLTERLLYAAGVIRALGSVDRGTTQTDTLALERQRGITIRSAVVSFPIRDVTVNLIDTPGHPDFIAEVERALAVLDGAVLVVSAVEGVQAQTRVLMRALRRLHIPTLVFVNKTDRPGADVDRVLRELRTRLAADVVAVSDVDVAVLAENDDALLGAYVAGEAVAEGEIRRALADQSRRGLVQPVLAGSALTGVGVDELCEAIVDLLPTAAGDPTGPPAALVFKIERGPAGDKIAYVRMFGGTLRTRDRVFVGDVEEKVTAIRVFDRGGPAQRGLAVAGEIAQVSGLRTVRIGDRIGTAPPPRHEFAPPTLEAVVQPARAEDEARLHVVLEQLAEQDPLIALRRDEQLSVSIYGEVQKEVLQETLAAEHGLAVTFSDTTPIYVERPVGVGEAVELLNADTNPFHAQIGLRVEPAPPASGVEFRVAVDHSRVPLYAYRRREDFAAAMDGYVRDALRSGPHGWEVTDCVVTLIDSWYSLADGPPSRRGPLSTPGDFRGLTPLVLRRALVLAETVVCEPLLHVHLEVPSDAIGAVLAAAARLGATLETPRPDADRAFLDGELAAARVNDLRRQLPSLSRGEGVLDSAFAGYRPVDGDAPRRGVSGPR